MRLLVIVNPSAGGGRAAARAVRLCADLSGAEIVHTTEPGHAIHLARGARSGGFEGVVAAGGDGTVFEVVNGLMADDGAGRRPAFGVLPVGTGNSFARDFALSDARAAVAAIARGGARRPVDVLALSTDHGDLFSVNLVSYGFSAVAGDLTNRRFKGLGTLGYVSAVVTALAGLEARPVEFSCDGEPAESGPFTLLSFCNTQYTGGAMRMAPGADPADGQVDIVRIGPMSRRRLLTSFPRIFRGTHPEMPEVVMSKARRVHFAPAPAVAVMIDGEIRRVAVRSLEVRPAALELLA